MNYNHNNHYIRNNHYNHNNFNQRRGKKRKPDEERPRHVSHKSDLVNRVQAQKGVRSNLVLLYTPNDSPTCIINNAASKLNQKISITSTNEQRSNKKKFQLKINEEVIVEDFYESQNVAKKELSEKALASFQETCFSILRKIRLKELPRVNLPETEQAETSTTEKVGGIGAKMMMKMGWGGGGLGAEEQGRTNLVEAHFHVKRQGLGNKNIAQEIRQMLTTYSNSKDLNPLAFSSEFTIEERAIIHQIANKLNLRTRSYGKNSERFLVVETKLRPWDLVNILIDADGENEQFKLIYPTKFSKHL